MRRNTLTIMGTCINHNTPIKYNEGREQYPCNNWYISFIAAIICALIIVDVLVGININL